MLKHLKTNARTLSMIPYVQEYNEGELLKHPISLKVPYFILDLHIVSLEYFRLHVQV